MAKSKGAGEGTESKRGVFWIDSQKQLELAIHKASASKVIKIGLFVRKKPLKLQLQLSKFPANPDNF